MSRIGHRKLGIGPSERATNREILWAAGFFEGDGTTTKRGSTAMVGISQKTIWPLVKMRQHFGGTISPQGNVFQWCISGARARGFLQTIYELVSPRRQVQIAVALGWR